MTEQINNSRIGEEKISVNELVDKLTLFDDDLMSRVFDKNIEAIELKKLDKKYVKIKDIHKCGLFCG